MASPKLAFALLLAAATVSLCQSGKAKSSSVEALYQKIAALRPANQRERQQRRVYATAFRNVLGEHLKKKGDGRRRRFLGMRRKLEEILGRSQRVEVPKVMASFSRRPSYVRSVVHSLDVVHGVHLGRRGGMRRRRLFPK